MLSEAEPVRAAILGAPRACVPRTRYSMVRPPSISFCMLLIARRSSFDAEVVQFLRVLFERADIRDGITVSYSAVYAIMKV
jgi:hypothetical protein